MAESIYNKHEMLENVITCLNGVAVSGEKSVNLLSQAFQMLYCLRKGLKEEDEAKNKTIDLLKEQLRRATEPDDGGEVLGGQHYDLKFGGDGVGTN